LRFDCHILNFYLLKHDRQRREAGDYQPYAGIPACHRDSSDDKPNTGYEHFEPMQLPIGLPGHYISIAL
jgi:hypothetical protein